MLRPWRLFHQPLRRLPYKSKVLPVPVRPCSATASDVREALPELGAIGAATEGLKRLGRYGENEVAWQRLARQLLEEGSVESMGAQELRGFVKVMAEDVGITQAGFWEAFTARALPVLRDYTQFDLEELLDVAEQYARIQAYTEDCIQVFLTTFEKVRRTTAVHTVEPALLALLLTIFGRAGAGSKALSGITSQLFNEMEERIMDSVEDFQVDDCLTLVASMASFRASQTPVLQELGREVLHPRLSELTGGQTSHLCHSYGELGWRHDTVFKSVASEILQEAEDIQKARIFGQATFSVKYSVSDIAFVALALLRLKMYRGNTAWFKWGDNYNDLLDVLEKRMETDLDQMSAKSLAAAAFVLGRARMGSEGLYKAMYEHMTKLLDGQSQAKPSDGPTEKFMDPPQHDLERFLHGLSMMGPTRQKDLDTQWLMQWLTKNVYTFVLSDFILVNRHLVSIKCCDRDYLLMLVPFYCDKERAELLTKTDIQELTNTYNGARIRETDMPGRLGRHFFWMLGRQYQKLHAEGTGGRRPKVRRVG